MANPTAPTLLSLVKRVRVHLREPQPRYWTDDEIFDHLYSGCKILWKEILDLKGEHFQTIDETNVSMAASATTLSGVPNDVFRVKLIEPRDLSSNSSNRWLRFFPKPFNSMEFQYARMLDTQDVGSSTIIYYELLNEGAPVNAPTIRIAPGVNASVNLRLCYLRTLPAKTNDIVNPIPGESDEALIAYALAWALAKRPENNGSPDPGALSVFSREKTGILTACTPRQEQEPEIADDLFGNWNQ
jgi:hypothetical protein